ncbi:hypothetical protein PILCRDRAFT_823505 [Piloderma croceum F 1598]|uniref:Protein N-terminal and lysine N-methyltransferase EFM7 n=1 Tax=Piloderma croceum (strain F 1598) TaxID=765440 RepID=A0A0C3FI18_PILCF|nr:hypothetical protein PILCRDRAFT_823505 [Piloderma croceum F 1598]
MSTSEDESDLLLNSLFTEPARPPSPAPTIVVYNRDLHHQEPCKNAPLNDPESNNWDHVDIRLVGTHSLWGHYLWNAARSFARYLDANPQLYRDQSVLELGAGGGLPGLVAAKNGARKVVLTDYPDRELIENLEYNVKKNIPVTAADRLSVIGYIWGRPSQPLIDSLPASPIAPTANGFDLILLSDLVFNHSQHDALLTTCENTLMTHAPSESEQRPAPTVLVFYTHHRPHLAHRDLEFFAKARERMWLCEEIVQDKFPPMFPDDPGEEEVRSTVHGWRLTRITHSP